MSVTTGVLTLDEVRARAAAALEPVEDTDPAVHLDYPEAVVPPCLVLLWDDPWLEPGATPAVRTMGGPCLWTANLLVWAVAGRLEPGAGVDVLEELVGLTLGRMLGDGYPFGPGNVAAPRVWTVAGIPLLGARVSYQVPCSI